MCSRDDIHGAREMGREHYVSRPLIQKKKNQNRCFDVIKNGTIKRLLLSEMFGRNAENLMVLVLCS